MSTNEALVVQQPRDLVLSPVMNLQTAVSRMKEFQEFVATYLQPSKDGGQDGGDYGPIPGAGTKKVLLKSGADKLSELYGLYDEYEITAHEDFESHLFYYRVKCILKSRRDDSVVGTGLGSCSTWESKYRWRDSQRVCPKCKAQSIIKGKDEYGGGWLCWARKNGCGTKFKDDDKSIIDQKLDRVENPDILDTVNTVLKMAKKRAKIDAVIGVTRSSGIFTQDLEESVVDVSKLPKVETIDHDIPLPSSPAQSGGGSSSKGTEALGTPAEPPKTGSATAVGEAILDEGKKAGPKKAVKEPPVGNPNDPPMCTLEMQTWLRLEFEKRFPEDKRKLADTFRKDWLRVHGYVNEKGEGTSTRIPHELFKKVASEMLNHAVELAKA